MGVGGVLGHNAGCEIPQWNGKFGTHLFDGDKTGGFHHRGMFFRSSKSRVVKITYYEKSNLWKGAFNAKVRIGGKKGKTKNSTFFPDSWSRVQVKQEVNEALFEALNSGSYVKTGKFIGYSSRGRPIEFYLRKGKPITAYPKIGDFQ